LPHSSDNDTTRATASLPGLEIEIVHRRPQGGDLEALSINLQAMPSFEAFGRSLEAANPLAFWEPSRADGLAPMVRGNLARSQPRADGAVERRWRRA